MKSLIQAIVFWYAVTTGHDTYYAEAGTLKCRFLNWLYEGDAEPMFDVEP